MGSQLFFIMATIAFYLIFVLMIGFYYAKKNESASDFYLGGRKLGPFVTAMSAEASDMSSWLLMGLPGVAYLSGSADVAWTSIGLALGTYVNWLITAKRLRVYTRITDSFTLPQFFSARFHDNRHILTAFAAAIIVIFFIPLSVAFSVLTVIIGSVLSVALAVNVVAPIIVTVVDLFVVLAGAFPLFFVHFSHVYPVLTVASIFTTFPYLYVPTPVTLAIPVPLFNVNSYVFLLNHI